MEPLVIFTDGSCMGNGRRDATGGIGVHFPHAELPDLSIVYPRVPCTNQKTELYAILMALKYLEKHKKRLDLEHREIYIKTDSRYSILSITQWAPRWIRHGWKTQDGRTVANRKYIEPIYELSQKYRIHFQYVPGHSGSSDPDSRANARADALATRAALRAHRTVQNDP